ncbi:isoprenoid synthase domain-containing protein [Rhizoctonia solani]|nr:isoprenoid synthase domain-containing protein [Rhizoctonia solani]
MAAHSSSHLFDNTLPPRLLLPDISKYTRQYFTLTCNPFHQEGEIASQAWFDNYGVLSGAQRKQFFDRKPCLLVSLSYPEADMEHLRPTMDFMLWLFAFDDMADLGEFKLEGLKRAVNITMNTLREPGGAQPELKIAATLHNFFGRMRQNGSSQAIRHFIEATDKYTQAITQEMVHKDDGYVQTFEDYRKYRPDTSAVKLMLAMIEYAHEINIPDEVLNDPVVSELALAGDEIISWANDIYSFPNEYARGHTHNLVFITMWHNGLGLQDAVEHVNQLIEKRVRDYLEAKATLRSFGSHLDGEVARYIQGIEYVIQACIDWSFVTTRYFGADVAKVRETRVVHLIHPFKADDSSD